MSSFIRRAIICATRVLPVVLLAALLSACGRGDVKVYDAPKEHPPAMAQGSLPDGHPDISSGSMPAMPRTAMPAKIRYVKPEGWAEVSPGQMRAASFNVKDEANKVADVSVIPLPGAAGGDESNVNRWRGQVGLGTLSADELSKSAEPVQIAGQPAKLYDVAGSGSGSGDPTRILGVIQHRDGTAWFFKMTGDDGLVAKQKAAFIEFLKSVKFEAGEAAADLPPGHPPVPGDTLPPGHPPIPGDPLPPGHPEISGTSAAATSAAPSTDGKPSWTVPTGWKEVPGGQFLVAKFTIGEGNTPAAVNVSMSAGDGGGLAANVNRWLGQLGKPPWNDDELKKRTSEVETPGGKVAFVEMSGTDARTGQPATVVGAMLSRNGQSWFYKLMGDEATVSAHKAAFTQFVKEVKY